jgi:hypothetical protein
MNFNKFGDSNNLLIWVVLIAIVIGFGNCREMFGVGLINNNGRCDINHRDRHNGNAYCGVKGNVIAPNPLGGINGFIGGNGFFIALVVVLLFLCKDKKEDCEDKDFECLEDI